MLNMSLKSVNAVLSTMGKNVVITAASLAA
jgi:hypothetical protein